MKSTNSHSTQAVLFDLDGVLVSSHGVWLKVMQEASRHFGGREVTLAEFAPLFGQGARADIDIFGLKCTPDELNAYFFENFDRCGRQSEDGVWVDPLAAPMLRKLKSQGLRLAITTNTMAQLAQSLLTQARLLEFFDVVTCADQVAHAKPAPDILLLALERLDVLPSAAWMIGDSKFDREAAHAAGIPFVGYRQQGDVRIDQLSQLPAVVCPPKIPSIPTVATDDIASEKNASA